MSEVFQGNGSFVLNYFAQRPTKPKIKRMSRHHTALEEPESSMSHGLLSAALDHGFQSPAPVLDLTGSEFQFTDLLL